MGKKVFGSAEKKFDIMSVVLISVIVPIYGVEEYISKTLVSLFNQTMLEGVEFILVNDFTPDNSMKKVEDVIANYPFLANQIQIINHPENKGVAAARNSGLTAAKGKYIIQVDGDDYCELRMLEKMYAEAIKTNTDIVVCDYIVDFANRQVYKKQVAPKEGGKCVAALLSGGLHGSTWNKLVKKSLFTENKIDFVVGINLWEDLTANIKLFFFAKKVTYLPEAFLHYRQINPESYTRSMSLKTANDIYLSIENITAFLSENRTSNYFYKELMYFKLSAKFRWLISTDGDVQSEYLKLYPETDKYIKSHPTFPVYYKYALLANRKGLANISRCIVSIINFLKRKYS